MPEVPLWKLKIEGQEYPPPQEGDETETQPVTPPEEEFPFAEPEVQSWYDSKKREYAEFLKTPEASLLQATADAFLSKPNDLRKFVMGIKSLSSELRGQASWLVLRTFFDKCKDTTLTDQVSAELWKPAIEWILHERHRKITMVELNDVWRSMEESDRPAPSVEPEETPIEPEFDDNYRFIGPGDDE